MNIKDNINEHHPLYYQEKTLKQPICFKPGDVRLIAFYLPQFYSFPENDKWWGKGFTEWSNVTKATPKFIGHIQPRIPGELGYYDLLSEDIIERQIDLAKKYGVSGFCFYYYLFDKDTRLLDKPLDLFLQKNINFPFCLMFVNESWTKTWESNNGEILMPQSIISESDLVNNLKVYLTNHNYILVDGKPLVIIYRINQLSNKETFAAEFRKKCCEFGIGEIYLCNCYTNGSEDAIKFGFDDNIEFPPHNVFKKEDSSIEKYPDFKGKVFSYLEVVRHNLNKLYDFPVMRGVMLGWDNSPRRDNEGVVFNGITPELFKYWLSKSINMTIAERSPDQRIVFINSWNEWAEGTYLEPDNYYGYAYLEAVHSAVIAQDKQLPAFVSIEKKYKISQYVMSKLNLAIQHELNNDNEKAGMLYTQSLNFFPELDSIWLSIIRIYNKLKNLEKARLYQERYNCRFTVKKLTNSDSSKITVSSDFPEFGYELIAVLPYAYHLYKNNKLYSTISGMDTCGLYFFSDNHQEVNIYRSWDNVVKLQEKGFPNSFIHRSQLDWDKFTPPPLKEHYQNIAIVFEKPTLVICNRYNQEWNGAPVNYLSVSCLNELFSKFKSKYQIVYIDSSDFGIEYSDHSRLNDDRELTKLYEYYPDIITLNDLRIKYSNLTINEIQCRVYAGCKRFISSNGGLGILCSYFGGENIIYSRMCHELDPEINSFYSWYSFFSKSIISVARKEQQLLEICQNKWIKNISLFNILITTNKHPNYFHDCIKSIYKQNYINYNIIVGIADTEDMDYVQGHKCTVVKLAGNNVDSYTQLSEFAPIGLKIILKDNEQFKSPDSLNQLSQRIDCIYSDDLLRENYAEIIENQEITGNILNNSDKLNIEGEEFPPLAVIIISNGDNDNLESCLDSVIEQKLPITCSEVKIIVIEGNANNLIIPKKLTRKYLDLVEFYYSYQIELDESSLTLSALNKLVRRDSVLIVINSKVIVENNFLQLYYLQWNSTFKHSNKSKIVPAFYNFKKSSTDFNNTDINRNNTIFECGNCFMTNYVTLKNFLLQNNRNWEIEKFKEYLSALEINRFSDSNLPSLICFESDNKYSQNCLSGKIVKLSKLQ